MNQLPQNPNQPRPNPQVPPRPPSPKELHQMGVVQEVNRILAQLLGDTVRVAINDRFVKEVSQELQAVGWSIVEENDTSYVTWGVGFNLPKQTENKKFLEKKDG